MNGTHRSERRSYRRICEALCGVVAITENGTLIDITPNRDHVLSQGFICVKGAAMAEVVNDPDRLLQPMRRTGGPGEFEPVSWEDAVFDIADRLRHIVDRHGAGAFATMLGNPLAFDSATYLSIEGFQKTVGTPWKFSVNAEDAASRMAATGLLYGSPAIIMVPDLWHTDMAVVIGPNPTVSHGSLVSEPRIGAALRSVVDRGGRVVVIDPRPTETARRFEHVAVHAGSDAWLLGAIVHVLFRDDLIDTPFVERWARGVDELRQAVGVLDPDTAAARCGVAAGAIEVLAHAFAAAPSAVVYGRTGTCTQAFGTLNNFLQDAINILTGNLDSRGEWLFPWGPIDFAQFAAMVGLDTQGTFRSRASGLPEVNGVLPSRALAEDIMIDSADRLRALCSVGANPVLSSGGVHALPEALERLDLHFSFDLYQNETNKHAHYILPVPTMYERQYVPFSFLGNMLRPSAFATTAVSTPRGSCRAEWTVPNDIARRMRLGGAYSTAPLSWLAKAGIAVKPRTVIDLILRTSSVGDLFGLRRGCLSIAKLQHAKPNGVALRPEVPTGVIGKKLRTPDKKIVLAPEPIRGELQRLAAQVPTTGDGGLRLIGMRETHSQNSWMHNVVGLDKRKAEQRLRIHPDDAAAADLTTGERALITSPASSVTATFEVTDEMFPGNVALAHGWGHSGGWRRANARGGTNSNLLAGPYPGCIEPLAGMSVLNGIPVTIRKHTSADTDHDRGQAPVAEFSAEEDVCTG